jgi:hypothetical protein
MEYMHAEIGAESCSQTAFKYLLSSGLLGGRDWHLFVLAF